MLFPLEVAAKRRILRLVEKSWRDHLQPGERLLDAELADSPKERWYASTSALYIEDVKTSKVYPVPWHEIWEYEEQGEKNCLIRIVRVEDEQGRFEIIGRFTYYRKHFTRAVLANLDPAICFTEL